MDLDGARADSWLPTFSPNPHRFEQVVDKVAWSTFLAGRPSNQSMLSDDIQGNTRQSRSKPDAANMIQVLQNRP